MNTGWAGAAWAGSWNASPARRFYEHVGMKEFTCQAVVVHCMDGRLQQPINDWLERRFSLSDYDRISLAGGVFDLEAILKQVEICYRRHKIRKVILINHENCAMYGDESTPERHASDLRKAELRIKETLPPLEVELYYLHLTGIFERVPGALTPQTKTQE
jgi:carbonic anhydrase